MVDQPTITLPNPADILNQLAAALQSILNSLATILQVPPNGVTLPPIPGGESELWKDHTWSGWITSGSPSGTTLVTTKGSADGKFTEQRTGTQLTRVPSDDYDIPFSVTFNYRAKVKCIDVYTNKVDGSKVSCTDNYNKYITWLTFSLRQSGYTEEQIIAKLQDTANLSITPEGYRVMPIGRNDYVMYGLDNPSGYTSGQTIIDAYSWSDMSNIPDPTGTYILTEMRFEYVGKF